MQLRQVSPGDLESIKLGLARLRSARYYFRLAGADRAAAYVARAIKSADGALRHAERAASESYRAFRAETRNG